MKMGKRASISEPPQGEVLAAMPTAAEMELLERKQIEMALRESEARLISQIRKVNAERFIFEIFQSLH